MTEAILAEIFRGPHRESQHRGHLVVADATGRVVFAAGDPETAIFPRSAIKGFQAIPLLAEGAAERFGLSPAELALSCASHSGLPQHVRTASSILEKSGCEVLCLECGTHWPSSASAARALSASGQMPTALHNNCSGKHAGFLCVARAAGHDTKGYVRADHPTMQRVTAAISEITGAALQDSAIDGCSIPTYRIPLRQIAAGFARFGTGRGLPPEFAAAAETLRGAVAAHPDMVAGAGRFDTDVMAALGPAVFVKTGAEGVQAGALPALGLGFAIKAEDGATRAADIAAAALLRRYLSHPDLDRLSHPVLKNWNGIEVGRVAPGPWFSGQASLD